MTSPEEPGWWDPDRPHGGVLLLNLGDDGPVKLLARHASSADVLVSLGVGAGQAADEERVLATESEDVREERHHEYLAGQHQRNAVIYLAGCGALNDRELECALAMVGPRCWPGDLASLIRTVRAVLFP